MKTRRAFSTVALAFGLIFSLVTVFADSLGLDNHSGWGRLRVVFLLANIILTTCSILYLAFQDWADSRITELQSKLKIHPFTSCIQRFGREYLFTLPIVGIVIFVYIWFVSSGTWTNWVSPTRYYASLAKGFENGHLFVPSTPDPRLEDLQNPYDPLERKGIDTPVDLSYYNGKYYLYWGPVPALVLVPIQQILHNRVGDLQLTFGFVCGIFLLVTGLLIRIRDEYFRNLPKWLLGASIFLAGTANPTLFILNNFMGARIYEASITGGQFFLIGGLIFAIISLRKKTSYENLIFAGTFWALSIGTRLFLFLPVGAMCFILLLSWINQGDDRGQVIKKVLAISLPLILGAITLGWYNWARFGSVAESGLYYQLAGVNLQKNYGNLIQLGYFPQNFYNYIFHAFSIHPQFPFLHAEYGNTNPSFPSYSLPIFYNSQQITGLVFAAPFVVFSLVSPAVLTNQSLKNIQKQDQDISWILKILIASFLTAFLFLMFFFWSAMRYIEDFMPSLLIFSIISLWEVYTTTNTKPSSLKYYSFFTLAIICITILISLLLAISINDARFQLISLLIYN